MPKQKNTEWLKLYVDETFFDCLSLQALLRRTSKSKLARSILVSKMEAEQWGVESLLERYAISVYTTWLYRSREVCSFEDHLDRVLDLLRNKHKLPERLITKIEEICREHHKRGSAIKFKDE